MYWCWQQQVQQEYLKILAVLLATYMLFYFCQNLLVWYCNKLYMIFKARISVWNQIETFLSYYKSGVHFEKISLRKIYASFHKSSVCIYSMSPMK